MISSLISGIGVFLRSFGGRTFQISRAEISGPLTKYLPPKESAESRFAAVLESGNGLTGTETRKSQCFKEFGRIHLFSASPLDSRICPDGPDFKAEQLSGVSSQDV